MKRCYTIFFLFFFFSLLTHGLVSDAQTQTYLITTPYGSGGMENNVIDSATLTVGNKWRRNVNTPSFGFSTVIAVDTVRSGVKALRLNYTLSGTRVVYSPKTQFIPKAGLPVTIQYFQRSTNLTNTVSVQPYLQLASVLSPGGYSTISAINTWEKKSFTTPVNASGGSATNYWGGFNVQKAGIGGDYYIDDVCIYSGPYDDVAPNAVTSLSTANVSLPYSENSNPTNSVKISWSLPSGGIDGGGYMVVAYQANPYSDNNPNQNGIYSVNSVITNGTLNLAGTVIGMTFGTASVPAKTTITYNLLKPGTQYWFKVYAFDKAFNYSIGVTTTFTTLPINNYYNQPNRPLNILGSWGNNPDGSGASPTSFSSNYQIFNVVRNSTINADWTLGGLLSKIVIGNGFDPIELTIPEGAKVLGDYNFPYSNKIDILKNANLSIENFDAGDSLNHVNTDGSVKIYIARVDSLSTISYSSNLNQRIINGIEYGNLVFSGGGKKEPTDQLTINGSLTVNSNIKVEPGFSFYVGGNCQVDAPAPSPDPDDPLYLDANTTMNYTGTGTHIINDNGWGTTIFKNVNVVDGSTVKLNSNLYVYGDLNINNGTLSIGNNHLTLNGNFTGNASSTLTGSKSANLSLRNNYSGKLFFNQGSVGGNYLNSLTVNSDVELGNKLQIAPSVMNDGMNTGFIRVAGGKLTTGDFLVLTSDATGTARIAESDGDYIEGEVTMQQFIPARRAWRLLTAPVDKSTSLTINQAWQNGQVYNSQVPANYNYDYINYTWNPTPVGFAPNIGTHITKGTVSADDRVQENVMSQGFDFGVNVVGATPSIRIFDGNNFSTTLADGTSSTAISDYPAYMLFVRGDRSINLANNNASPTPTTLQYTAPIGKGIQNLADPINSITLLGNPYPSPIDFDLLHNVNTNLQDKFYIWDARLGSFGGYRTVEDIGGYESSPVDLTLPNTDDARHIQSGQGFFVIPEVNGAGIQIQESFKSDFTRPQVFGRALAKMYISMYQRSVSDSISLTDGVMACFDGSFTSAVDNKDALKFSNFNENFYLRRNGKRLSIEARADIKADDTLFFGFTNMVVRDYQFKMKAGNFGSEAVSAYLVDKFLNKTTPLGLDGSITSVNFSVTSNAASKSDARFMIIFKPNTILPVTLTSVKAYKKINDIEVEWTVSNEMDVNYYEVEKSADGSVFAATFNTKARNNRTGTELYNWLDTKPNDGYNYYRIKTTEKSGEIKYSAVVRVLMDKNSKGDISFFPNPVTGHQISLQLNNMKKANYTIEMYNQLGQKVYNYSFKHVGGTGSQTLVLNKSLPKGVYQMKIIGTVDKQFKVIVQ